MLQLTTPPKVALITGVTGQYGAYLSELLLGKGYEVHAIKRRSSLFNTDRIERLYHAIRTSTISASSCNVAICRRSLRAGPEVTFAPFNA